MWSLVITLVSTDLLIALATSAMQPVLIDFSCLLRARAVPIAPIFGSNFKEITKLTLTRYLKANVPTLILLKFQGMIL